MFRPPQDHPLRLALADEVHARPPEALSTPMRAAHVAVCLDAQARSREGALLARLCRAHGVAPPPADATHVSVMLGTRRLKWERHGEFSGYTVFEPGVEAAPFASSPWDALGEALGADGPLELPGRTLVSADGLLIAGDVAAPDPALLAACFGTHVVIGSRVADGAALACTDFRLHGDGLHGGGSSRMLLVDGGLTPRQAGRLMQRMFEIEAYRMMALLALPVARELAPRLARSEAALAALTGGIARDDGQDEALLHQLSRLAADVEQELAASQFRFAACRAYSRLVERRIADLRETRLAGLQTIEEFMKRRFSPAVDTCESVSQRLLALSERVAQASSLLATRVGIARERQNQHLLASMNRRAQLQLHLQQTVEGLSVAAIAYYAVGLVGYLAKGAKAAGWGLDAELVTGLAVPVLAVGVFVAVRRIRRRVHDAQHAPGRTTYTP